MIVTMVDPEGQLLREIADKRMTRDDVKLTYAFAICQADDVDFARVNAAIIERWSIAALRYIKDGAWRLNAARRKRSSGTDIERSGPC